MAACALIPACLFLVNYFTFRAPRTALPSEALPSEALPHVAVLIPARNEEDNIADALRYVLASSGVALEVLVYDDASTDRTAAIVRNIAQQDNRIRLIAGAELPSGWNGKQHACWRLAQESAAPLLLFLDADVRLGPDAIARCIAQRQVSGVALLSGFPRIVTVTWMEWLVLPLIHFVLLGLLPMWRMRNTTIPAYAAGCGQFFLAEREAYFVSGGHAAIRATRHDGLMLPTLFRQHRLRTDVCDLTELASVRMYSSAAGVWNGLAKNATEGLGSPGKIVPLTLFLLLGQVLPACLLVWMLGVVAIWLPAIYMHHIFIMGVTSSRNLWALLILFALALFASFLPRLLAVRRFRQSLRSAWLHPLGTTLLLAIQWYALARNIFGKPVSWRARN